MKKSLSEQVCDLIVSVTETCKSCQTIGQTIDQKREKIIEELEALKEWGMLSSEELAQMKRLVTELLSTKPNDTLVNNTVFDDTTFDDITFDDVEGDIEL